MEFSNYIETRDDAGGTLDGNEILIASKDGSAVRFTTQQLIDELVGDIEVDPWTDDAAGTVERSTQAESEAIATQVAAASVGSLSDDRTASETGLYYLLTSFVTKALTWTAMQNFMSAPRLSSTTANQFLKVDLNKDVTSVAAATQSEAITGTDDTKPITSLSLEQKRSIKSVAVSNSATGTTNIDMGLKQEVKVVYQNTVTGAIEVTWSNGTNLEFFHLTIPVTGSGIAITFPSSVRMSRYNETASGDGWNQSSKILTVSSIGTADLHEFSLVRIGSVWKLNYDGPARA